MVILTQPASFSLSGNLEKFQIRANETISFILMKGTEEILSASYTPGSDQAIVIDLREIVESHLSFRFIDQQTSYVQESLVADFTAIINGTEYPFRVLRGGVDRLGTSAESFCRANFLTWQPQIKPVTYYTPEFLGYYCLEDATVYVKAYFTAEDGNVTSEVKAIATLFHGYAYTIPVQYAVICSAFDSRFPSFYDVWVQNSAANRLTYVQRYVADNILSEQEEWILFENSLGGIDTFRAYGQSDFKGKHTHNVAEIDDVSLEYRVDTERTFQKSTGFLNNYQRRWLLDFFPSKVKYVYVDNYIRSIVVTEDNTTYTDKELPTEYKFTYRYADARPYLNLSRTETLPSNLDIVVPELGSFTIPPRLVEFPTQPLSEGVLFPVQNPYSEQWGTTTIGSILNHVLKAISVNYDGVGGFGHAHANYELLNLLSWAEGYLLVDGKKIKAGYADDVSPDSELYKKFLRKDQPDTASELITFLKGLVIGTNGSGLSVLADGTSQAVVDRLYVRIKAYFDSLEVKKKTFVGGEQILSPAGMKCIRVETLASAYRCYFRAEEDGVQIENEFVAGQLAICQECNIRIGVAQHVGNRFYWREVVGVGADYIDLSIASCAADSDIPVDGDDIVGLGHRTDVARQSAIVLSSVGSTAPSIIFYQGIDDFSLSGKEVMALEYDRSTGHAKVRIYGSTYIGDRDRNSYIEYSEDKGVDIKGTFHIEKGSTGWRNMDGLPEDINAAADAAKNAQEAIENTAVGSINLLRNSGFTGNFTTGELDNQTSLSDKSELFSQSLEYWTGIATVNDEPLSVSGRSASIGSLSQTVSLIENENYVISFKARGQNLAISCGNYNVAQELSADYRKYIYKFNFAGSGIFLVSGTAEVCELQIERGTIATDWKPSILDNDKTLAEFHSLSYLTDAIKNGSVDILGGLILSSMIQLGNYKDGLIQKVNAGISGIYNNDDDVAFWSGGSFEEAVRTVLKLKYDKKHPPTDEEWNSLAKYVATHGGDVFLRGYIYALGGLFRGTIDVESGGYRIKISPNSMNGCPSISIIDKNGMELLDMSMHDLGLERIPYVSLYSPDNKTQTYLSYYGLVTAKEFQDGSYRQTEIMPGRIMITDGLKILWDANHEPK